MISSSPNTHIKTRFSQHRTHKSNTFLLGKFSAGFKFLSFFCLFLNFQFVFGHFSNFLQTNTFQGHAIFNWPDTFAAFKLTQLFIKNLETRVQRIGWWPLCLLATALNEDLTATDTVPIRCLSVHLISSFDVMVADNYVYCTQRSAATVSFMWQLPALVGKNYWKHGTRAWEMERTATDDMSRENVGHPHSGEMTVAISRLVFARNDAESSDCHDNRRWCSCSPQSKEANIPYARLHEIWTGRFQ